MKAIRFHTKIEADQTIRLPEGVTLTPGEAEVIVLQTDSEQARPTETPTEPLVTRLARIAEKHGIHGLPADLAENHDHYAHGAPKGIDES